MIGPGSDKKEDRLWLYFCTSNITLCWSVKWLQCLYKDWVYWESICDALKLCLALITSALQARKSYRMSLNPSHVTSCCQLWQQLQAVYSFDSSRMLWQLFQAFPSFDTCYKLLTAFTAVTSCSQHHLTLGRSGGQTVDTRSTSGVPLKSLGYNSSN